MILGIDTGLEFCGWALLDDEARRFVDLGVVVAHRDGEMPSTLDRARRANLQAQVIAEVAPRCSTIVVERMSFPPGAPNAKIAIGLSWGIVLGVVATITPRPRLLTIAPQRWQREVLPNAGRTVDYDKLSRVAAAHILERHPAADKFRGIPIKFRSHAIDAAMIALCAALRPHRCEGIAA